MKRIIRKTTIIIFCGIIFLCGCEEIMRRTIGGFGGSYPFAESWEINAKESVVIDAIKKFTVDGVGGKPHGLTELESIAKRDTLYDWLSPKMVEYRRQLEKDSLTPLPKYNSDNSYPNYWLFIDFYYTDTKQVVHAWTRPETDSTKTTIAFVSIGDPGNRSQTKLINKDFWYFENKKQIVKFKKFVVDRIDSIIKQNNNRTR